MRFNLKRVSRVSLLAVALTTFANLSSAEEAADLSEAQRLLNEGLPEQAAILLQAKINNDAGNAEYDYLLGLALYQSGQTGEAMFAFERVLMSNPDNIDARLKAARLNIERGNTEYALELLQALPDETLNHQQRQEKINIQAYATNTSNWVALSAHGYFLGGIGRDSNVSSGPNQSSLIIPVLSRQPPPLPPKPVQLGAATRAQDTVSMAEAGLSLQKLVGKDTWLTSDINLHQSTNNIRSDVDYSYANLNAGILTYRGSDSFGAALLGQSYQVAGTTYRNSFGANLNWTHFFDNKISLTGYVQQLNFFYPTSPINNTTRHITGTSVQSAVGDTGRLQFGIYSGREDVHDPSKPHFAFRLWGANLSGSIDLSPVLTLSAAANYEPRAHNTTDALYLITRSDSLLITGTSLDYKSGKNWHVIPSYTYTRNASNTQLYSYTRNSYQLQFKRDFDND